MPMPCVLDFARIARASYYANCPTIPRFMRSHFGQLTSGFKGSYYRSSNGESIDIVVAFAGTDLSTDTEKQDGGDVAADVGFAGSAITELVSGSLGAISLGGGLMARGLLHACRQRLAEQEEGAIELTRQAQWLARKFRGRVFLVGHSLGGGLAQIVAARLALNGVSFNAPTVSQLNYQLPASARFLNVRLRADPISSLTMVIGKHLGSVHELSSEHGPVSAHFIDSVVATLARGPYSEFGRRPPF